MLYIGQLTDSININWGLSAELGPPPPFDPDFIIKDREPSKYAAYNLLENDNYDHVVPAGQLELKIRIDTTQVVNYIFG